MDLTRVKYCCDIWFDLTSKSSNVQYHLLPKRSHFVAKSDFFSDILATLPPLPKKQKKKQTGSGFLQKVSFGTKIFMVRLNILLYYFSLCFL